MSEVDASLWLLDSLNLSVLANKDSFVVFAGTNGAIRIKLFRSKLITSVRRLDCQTNVNRLF